MKSIVYVRFVAAWIALGHCLSLQQESEHAVSSYRCASRLAPGDYLPLLFMSRELVSSVVEIKIKSYTLYQLFMIIFLICQIKMNNFPTALHLLGIAVRMEPKDPQILNEIGVIMLQLNRWENVPISRHFT